jgi:hypothetical protein
VWAPSGVHATDLERGAKLMMADLPSAQGWKRDYHYWHTGTRFIKQCSPKHWEEWKTATVRALDSCRETSTGCCRGSWSVEDRWTLEGGRVFATAINTLTSEALLLGAPAAVAPVEAAKPAWVAILKSGGKLKLTSYEETANGYVMQLMTGGSTKLPKEAVERIEKYDPAVHE